MKLYHAFINWPAGEQTLGIFSSDDKAQEFWNTYYEGKSYMQGEKYTKDQFEVEEYELDEGTVPVFR